MTDDVPDMLDALEKSNRESAKGYKEKLKRSEDRIAALEKRIEKLQQSKWEIPKAVKGKPRGNTFCRAIIPDTHGSLLHKESAAAMLQDLRSLDVREVVWLGDHLECGGFLAQHWTLGYVAQTDYTFEADIDAANTLLDAVQIATPNATHYYIEGNHERRIEAWCMTQALKKREDAEYLMKHFSAENVLRLKERKFNYYRQGVCYMDCPIPATIRLGKCYFTHGHTSAKHAAAKMLERYGHNVVFGHVHRSHEASTSTVSEGTIKAWCPGCLCEKQPLWRHTAPTEWNHGYAVQLVRKDGSFLHINVPITDGKSYLIPFTKSGGS